MTTAVFTTASFDDFYALTYTTMWRATTRDRARIFHGGAPCPQAPLPPKSRAAAESATCCPDCTASVDDALMTLYTKWVADNAAGNVTDPVTFAIRNSRHRFSDSHEKEQHAHHGTLQRPKRAIFDAEWVDTALDGDDHAKEVAYLIVCFVQGHDQPEPGSWFPYHRWADHFGCHGPDAAGRMAAEVDDVIARLRAAKPNWVARNIDAHTRHLARVAGISTAATDHDNRSDDVPDPQSTIEDDTMLAKATLRAARAAIATGAPPAAALVSAIRQVFGDELADRSRSSSDWVDVIGAFKYPGRGMSTRAPPTENRGTHVEQGSERSG